MPFALLNSIRMYETDRRMVVSYILSAARARGAIEGTDRDDLIRAVGAF